VVIHLDPRYYTGKTFTIVTHGNSQDNMFIQKARLNGAELNTFWFKHEEFAHGGELELWLDSQPDKSWGTAEMPPVAK
jgi:putative alpha-1,2-mannosidase